MIRLRAAEPTDEFAFWELRRQIQPDLTRGDHLTWWKAIAEHRWLAYDGATLVGVIRVSRQGEVHVLVASSERGKGLGTSMLEAIQEAASARGLTRLWAQIEPGNQPSQRAFTAAGYAPTRFEVTL